MNDNAILSEVRGHVGLLTVNRPKVHNSLSTPVLLELEQAFIELENNPEVRVIVFTGAGDKAFVAGGDLSEMASRDGIAHYQEFAEDIHRVFRRFEVSDKPTIAA
ncbi:enoyl-CoA hydratase, partial [Marinobacter sp. Z-F4-2]